MLPKTGDFVKTFFSGSFPEIAVVLAFLALQNVVMPNSQQPMTFSVLFLCCALHKLFLQFDLEAL